MKTIVIGLIAGSTILLPTAAPQRPAPPLTVASIDGGDSYRFYCASCHGKTGKSDGPLAAALKTAPTDLSSLSRRNNGTFPRDRVTRAIVTGGQAIAAHGPSDMPVWGVVFRGLDASEVRVRLRIEHIVAYVEALQEPASEDPGAGLFRTYCGACHGQAGRGDGPVGGQLLQSPTDLTRFTERNGGVFPGDRVYDIVDGRGIRAHGNREMPVWGDAFSVGPAGLDERAVKQRIEAIVKYLRAIQRRSV